MIVAWKVVAAAQRSNVVRTRGASRYKKKVSLSEKSREEGTRQYTGIGEQIKGALTAWRKKKKGKGQDTKAIDRGGTLTSWRPQTSHVMETKRLEKGHLHSGDRRGRHKSKYRKKTTVQGALTPWRPHREGQVRIRKETTERGALTIWRPQRKGQVRTWRKSNWVRGTHFLETRGRNKSGHRKKATGKGTLTNWRP